MCMKGMQSNGDPEVAIPELALHKHCLSLYIYTFVRVCKVAGCVFLKQDMHASMTWCKQSYSMCGE